MAIKYVHTNIIASDWRRLADFYIQVFGCKPLLPERDLSGEWVEKLTGVEGAKIKGVHLALPGYEDGPTLEIFEFDPWSLNIAEPTVNFSGIRHIAFHVDNVEETLFHLLQNGGSKLGKIVKKQYETLGLLTVVYARDPEGNIIELQNWRK